MESAAAQPTSEDVPYVELHCKSNYSFLEGASHADELVAAAQAQGHSAIAVTDRNSLAGVVRAHVAARAAGLKLLVGSEIVPDDGAAIVLLATDRASYGRLSQLITVGRRRAPKGECRLRIADIEKFQEGLICCVPFSTESQQRFVDAFRPGASSEIDKLQLVTYHKIFGDRCYALAELHRSANDGAKLKRWLATCEELGIALAAANDVHFHIPERRPLHDVVTAIRCRKSLEQLGHQLHPNGERHIKSGAELLRLFGGRGELIQRTIEIADRCHFSLDEVRYEYPEEIVPDGTTPDQHLTNLTDWSEEALSDWSAGQSPRPHPA